MFSGKFITDIIKIITDYIRDNTIICMSIAASFYIAYYFYKEATKQHEIKKIG